MNFEMLSAEKIRIAIQTAIGNEVLLRGKIDVESFAKHELRATIVRLRSYVHAMPREKISVHKQWPADWWQAFRARWFPRWWLRKFPVKYERVDIEQTIYGPVCPHLLCEDNREHFQWMAGTPEKFGLARFTE